MSADLQAIAGYLRAHGCQHVSVEYPGCVVIWAEDLMAHPDLAWWFGTANGTWAGDLMNGAGEYLDDTRETGIAAHEVDPATIAEAILTALAGDGEPADPNDCPECARSYGPHYTGPCTH